MNSSILTTTLSISSRYLVITTPTEQEVYRFVGVHCVFVKKIALDVTFSGKVGETVLKASGDNLQVGLATTYQTNDSSFSVGLYDYGHISRRASS